MSQDGTQPSDATSTAGTLADVSTGCTESTCCAEAGAVAEARGLAELGARAASRTELAGRAATDLDGLDTTAGDFATAGTLGRASPAAAAWLRSDRHATRSNREDGGLLVRILTVYRVNRETARSRALLHRVEILGRSFAVDEPAASPSPLAGERRYTLTMPDAGRSEGQSRCPTCNDSLTPPLGVHGEPVECPSCQRKTASAPLLDAPLLDAGSAELTRDDARTLLRLSPPPPDATAPAPEEPADEGRTHLMLRNPRAVAAPEGRDSDARTHLLLNADDLKDEDEPEVPVPPTPLPASDPWSSNAHALNLEGPKPQDPDEARTHLLLAAEDLKELPAPALGRLPAKLGQLAPHALGLGRRVDLLFGGRWTLVLAALGFAAGAVVPLCTALSASAGAVLHAWVAVSVWIGFALYGCAWFAKLAAEDGEWGPGVPGPRFRASVRLLLEDLGELGRSPPYLKLLSSAQVLGIAGLLGLGLSSLRTCTRLLFDLPDSGALSALSGLLLLLGVGLARYAGSVAPRVPLGAEDQKESVAAASQLPPIIDLSEPLPASFIGGHTPLHRVLVALSQWRAERWPDEVAYRARLERYLQRSLLGSRVERDQALGGSSEDGRVDLVVDDLVFILVKRRFQKTSAAHAVAALTRHALARPNKPMLLVVFDAPREAVFEIGSLETLIDLHQRLPVVTARMPVRRA